MSEEMARAEAERCARCEGDGSYSELAPCTTCGKDCACNGPRVIVDPCPDCNGSGEPPRGILSWASTENAAPRLTKHRLMRFLNVEVPRAGAPRGVNHVISPNRKGEKP